MENNNLSEEALMLKELENDIEDVEFNIMDMEMKLANSKLVLEKLKERKKSLLNYLNTDNN